VVRSHNKRNTQITESDCWKDALDIQRLLILQGIVLIVIILAVNIWMRHYKQDPAEDNPVALWHSIIRRLQEAIVDIGNEYRYRITITLSDKINLL